MHKTIYYVRVYFINFSDIAINVRVYYTVFNGTEKHPAGRPDPIKREVNTMTLKEFRKVNSERKTMYILEFFQCDVEVVRVNGRDDAENLKKIELYDGAKVADISIIDGVLTVTCVITMEDDD